MPVPAGGQGPLYAGWPAVLGRVVAPAGVCPSAVLPEPAAIPMTTQCTYRPFTASGSSTTRAPPAGADHANGGAMSAPLQVYCTGIGAPSAKAGLLIVNGRSSGAFGAVRPRVVTFGADDVLGWLSPWPPQPTSAPSSASAPATAALR